MERLSALIPYKGLSATWQPEESAVLLELPWITCEVAIDDQNKGWVQQAVVDLKGNSKSPAAQKFLRQLEDYPISYTAPHSQTPLKEPKDNQLLTEIDVSLRGYNFFRSILGSSRFSRKSRNPSPSLLRIRYST
jgi:hypothetical protein